MGKRGSTAAGSPAKRAKAEVTGRIRQVVKVLTDDELECEVPMQSREMLAKGAPSALRSAVEERHALQEKVLGHIKDTLADMSTKLTATKDKAEAAAAEATSVLEAAKAELNTATEALAEAQNALDASEEKLSETTKAMHAAEAEVRKANLGVKASQKAADNVEKEKIKFTSFAEKPEWKALMEGTCESEKERNKFIRHLVNQFGRLGAEDALLASAPAALAKGPEDRKSFDTMVIDSLLGVLKKGEEDSDTKLQEIATERATVDAEAVAKTGIFEKAKAELADQSEETSKLQAARDEKDAASKEVAKKVEEIASTADERGEERDTAAERLAEFAEVVQSLEVLAVRSLAPDPEPEPEAAEVPAEEAAKEAAAAA